MNYVLLKPGVISTEFEKKIKNIFSSFKGFELQELQLCPMWKLQIGFNDRPDFIIVIGMFALIGLFVLIMSIFNYINLTIANASTRGKEVAIKKITGSNRNALIKQFLGESLILALLAAILAIILASLLLPVYNSIVNADIEFHLNQQYPLILLFMAFALLVGIGSGIYPAFIISSFPITDLFKRGLIKQGKNRINIRQVLVVIQFSISIFLICLSLFFLVQINYMTNKDLGFNKENLLYVKINASVKGKQFDDLRNRLLQNPEIVDASMSKNLPFVSLGGGMINCEGAAPDERISYRPNVVSYDFVDNMGLKIIQGRNFSRQLTSDIENACLINETALRCFNFDNPIGKRIKNNSLTIIGVVKIFQFKDMHNNIEPAVLTLASGEMNGEWSFAFRYSAGNRSKVRTLLESEFNHLFPNDPFEFHEMVEAFQNESTMKTYQVIKKSIVFFTLFNIFLAVMGLYGLVSFATIRRKKEISIQCRLVSENL